MPVPERAHKMATRRMRTKCLKVSDNQLSISSFPVWPGPVTVSSPLCLYAGSLLVESILDDLLDHWVETREKLQSGFYKLRVLVCVSSTKDFFSM